jgi:23S rRNA pseudouridine2457 synthase
LSIDLRRGMLLAHTASRNVEGALLCCAPAMPLILLNKPFRVLCQFRDDKGRPTLADYIDVAAVYPAGRLDFDSEGLLLLTDDGPLQARISQPRSKLAKHYWAQVEGLSDEKQLQQLAAGVTLKDGPACAASAATIKEPDSLWERVPPIRERRNIPTSWIDLAITEGRNRQVRRMTSAVGLPTLRLVRHRIGPWTVAGLKPGESVVIDNKAAWKDLTAYLEEPFA